jgi:hypothetical protein
MDGYPEYTGDILLKHYTDPEKIAALMDLGNLSGIAASTECPEGHFYFRRVEGYCVAYGRDLEAHLLNSVKCTAARRGEKTVPVEEDYTYLFKDNKWWLKTTPEDGVLLTPELCVDTHQ